MIKRIWFIFILALSCLYPDTSQARNVSYVGGWTLSEKYDSDSLSTLLHYTVTPQLSLGARYEYMRDEKWHFAGGQANWLIRRWNKEDAQANLYLLSGAGTAYSDAGQWDSQTEPALFSGLAADWENRRYFVSYENRFFYAGRIDKFYRQKARLGIAPYVADYGDLHTWFMVEISHDTNGDSNPSLTPLLRFFKGSVLAEIGCSLDADMMANLTIVF